MVLKMNLTDAQLKRAIEATTAQAITALDKTIQEDSLYLLFEWDKAQHSLNIVVTDASKTQDAPQATHAAYALAPALLAEQQALEDKVYYWLHDYLTTATKFFHYSLVAIFHASERSNTRLL